MLNYGYPLSALDCELMKICQSQWSAAMVGDDSQCANSLAFDHRSLDQPRFSEHCCEEIQHCPHRRQQTSFRSKRRTSDAGIWRPIGQEVGGLR